MGWATAIELFTLALALAIFIAGFSMAGVVAAAIATLVGRGAGIAVLVGSVRRVVAGHGVG
jgi:hypothetical protein